MRHPGYRANGGVPFGMHLNGLHEALSTATAKLEHAEKQVRALREENARLRAALQKFLETDDRADAAATELIARLRANGP